MAQHIDHTCLRMDATSETFAKLYTEAKEHHFYSVCVPGSHLEEAKKALEDSDVKVAVTVGFPHGNEPTEVKLMYTTYLKHKGADEIDVVWNMGYFKDGNYYQLHKELKELADMTPCLKVILETCLLSTEEIIDACILCVFSGAHFVKTSTGFSTGGATVRDIRLMKLVVGNSAQVKASGGVKEKQFAESLIANGASRIGSSASIALL